MPKFDADISGAFTVEISKNFKVLADNEEEARKKVVHLFNKFLDSFPFSLETEEDLAENVEISELSEDDESLVYDKEEYNQFVSDMEEAGLEVSNYRGRFWYNGPAVRCDSPDEVISKTSVACQWDSMGLGFVVYPK